jgi:hypothetical protein
MGEPAAAITFIEQGGFPNRDDRGRDPPILSGRL